MAHTSVQLLAVGLLSVGLMSLLIGLIPRRSVHQPRCRVCGADARGAIWREGGVCSGCPASLLRRDGVRSPRSFVECGRRLLRWRWPWRSAGGSWSVPASLLLLLLGGAIAAIDRHLVGVGVEWGDLLPAEADVAHVVARASPDEERLDAVIRRARAGWLSPPDVARLDQVGGSFDLTDALWPMKRVKETLRQRDDLVGWTMAGLSLSVERVLPLTLGAEASIRSWRIDLLEGDGSDLMGETMEIAGRAPLEIWRRSRERWSSHWSLDWASQSIENARTPSLGCRAIAERMREDELERPFVLTIEWAIILDPTRHGALPQPGSNGRGGSWRGPVEPGVLCVTHSRIEIEKSGVMHLLGPLRSPAVPPKAASDDSDSGDSSGSVDSTGSPTSAPTEADP
jgi:hypothetical protein